MIGIYKEKINFDQYKKECDFEEKMKELMKEFGQLSYFKEFVDNINSNIKLYLANHSIETVMAEDEKEEIDFLILLIEENCKNKIFVEKYYNYFYDRLLRIQDKILIRISEKIYGKRIYRNRPEDL